MNIRILAVGRLKEKYWRDAMAEYEKRLRAYCNFSAEEVKEAPDDDTLSEGEDILRRIKDDEYVIALAIKGEKADSVKFSRSLERLGIEGKSKVTFVIGGSMGLSPAVTERADKSISFSDMTFPHQLMRVILAEQIYRAFKIMKGEKYHK